MRGGALRPDDVTATSEPATRFDLRGKTVEAVKVLGNTTVGTATILNQVRTREGDKYDPETVQEDYPRIYGLRKFANVEAQVEPSETGGVIVVFIVTEQNQIRSIAYRGNNDIDTVTIRNTVDIKEGEAIDRFRLSLAKQAIENLYRDRNYPFAHVELDSETLTTRGEVVFKIVEGPNVRIRNITFPGARSFTVSKLKDQLQTKTWIFIFRHGTYDPEQVDDDVAALRRFYQQRGFFDARVGRKLIWSADMTELQIDFVIEEGVRYTVDSIIFKGNASVTEAQLRKNSGSSRARPSTGISFQPRRPRSRPRLQPVWLHLSAGLERSRLSAHRPAGKSVHRHHQLSARDRTGSADLRDFRRQAVSHRPDHSARQCQNSG